MFAKNMTRLSTPDVEAAMERIQVRLNRRTEEEYLLSLHALPKPHRSLWSTWVVQCEVENGGFAQYFWNIEAEGFYDEAERGFTALAASGHLQIFQQARGLITPHLPVMHTWQGANDRFSKYKPLLKREGVHDQLLKLDGEFYDLRPSLLDLRQQYISANVDALSA
jgi:hypothetical protein